MLGDGPSSDTCAHPSCQAQVVHGCRGCIPPGSHDGTCGVGGQCYQSSVGLAPAQCQIGHCLARRRDVKEAVEA